MNLNYAEKRLYKRAAIEEEAKFKLLGEQNAAAAYNYEKAVTKNISKGGVCMLLPMKIDEGSVIRVEIPVSDDNEEKFIKAFCEVQWCYLKDKEQKYEVGLSFIALKEEDEKYLQEYVDKKAM